MQNIIFECPEDIDHIKISRDSKSLKYVQHISAQNSIAPIQLNIPITTESDLIYFELLIHPTTDFVSFLSLQLRNNIPKFKTPLKTKEITDVLVSLHSLINLDPSNKSDYRFTFILDPALSCFLILSNGMFIKKGYFKLEPSNTYCLALYTGLCILDLRLEDMDEINKISLDHYKVNRKYKINHMKLASRKISSKLDIYSLHTSLKEYGSQNHRITISNQRKLKHNKLFYDATKMLRRFFLKNGFTHSLKKFQDENNGLFPTNIDEHPTRVVQLIRTRENEIIWSMNKFDAKPLEKVLKVVGNELNEKLLRVIKSYIKLICIMEVIINEQPNDTTTSDLRVDLDMFDNLNNHILETHEIDKIKMFLLARITGVIDETQKQEIVELIHDKNRWILEMVINSLI